MKKHLLFVTLLLLLFTACKKDTVVVEVVEEEPPLPSNEYDKGAMQEHWAKYIIKPAYLAYYLSVETLDDQVQAFADSPNFGKLRAVRKAWLEAYMAWQQVPFSTCKETDMGFELKRHLAEKYYYTNFYPLNITRLQEDIDSKNYTPSNSNYPNLGFAAVEYLLYGLANTDTEILQFYKETANEEGLKHRKFLRIQTNNLRLQALSFLDDFNKRFERRFGTGVYASNTSCTEPTISNFFQSYLDDIVIAKIGQPAGTCEGCFKEPNKDLVEGRFSRIYSKTLLLEALNASQNFFNGVPFGGSFEERSSSMYQYLDHLGTQKDGKKLGDLINDQFDKTRTEIDKLKDDLGSEIENNLDQVVKVYEQLEQNKILMEDHMLDAMNISR